MINPASPGFLPANPDAKLISAAEAIILRSNNTDVGMQEALTLSMPGSSQEMQCTSFSIDP